MPITGPINRDIDWTNIQAVQDEITCWASNRFPHRTDHHAIYKLMVEEIPELAMHKKEKGIEGIGPELADCFILLLDLASLWEIDVVDAIRSKMAINYNREWKQDSNGIMQHVSPPPGDSDIPF
jgi:NTP pyrophosphatase (non-canonical NTP hydrolase)